MTKDPHRDLGGLAAAIACVTLADATAAATLAAASPAGSRDAQLPVSASKRGLTPSQAQEFLGKWGNAAGR